jgi:uncharacterized metal-binding protein YceD (DUF177 family)
MPELVNHSASNPEFARIVDLARLRDANDFQFDIAPSGPEAEAVARLMGARSIRKMRFQGTLTPLPAAGWRLEGRLGATAVQTCVISLDPVTTRIDQHVRRTWLPSSEPMPAEIVLVPGEDEDEVEPLGPTIDLGLVAIEALALALPDYPRKPGAAIPAELQAPAEEDDRPKPFAALAALKDRLDGGS